MKSRRLVESMFQSLREDNTQGWYSSWDPQGDADAVRLLVQASSVEEAVNKFREAGYTYPAPHSTKLVDMEPGWIEEYGGDQLENGVYVAPFNYRGKNAQKVPVPSTDPDVEFDTEKEEELSRQFRDELVPELEQRGYEIDCPGSGGAYTLNRAGEEMPEDEIGNMEVLLTGQDAPTNRDHNMALVQRVAGEHWEQDKDVLTRLVDNLWNSQVVDSPEY